MQETKTSESDAISPEPSATAPEAVAEAEAEAEAGAGAAAGAVDETETATQTETVPAAQGFDWSVWQERHIGVEKQPEVPAAQGFDWSVWLLALLPPLLAATPFVSVLRNGFVDWDDFSNFVSNRDF